MSKRLKIFLIIGIILIILIIGFLIFIHIVNGPSKGSIIISETTTNNNQASSFNLQPVYVDGKYINFSYPNSFSVDNTLNNKGSTLEEYLYKYSDKPETWLLALSVNKLQNSLKSDDSAYTLRINQPTKYKLTNETIGTNNFYIFKDLTDSGFNQTAIVFNGNKSTDIALSGSDFHNLSDLQKSFDLVIRSFQWK